jgi:hypothetical protein
MLTSSELIEDHFRWNTNHSGTNSPEIKLSNNHSINWNKQVTTTDRIENNFTYHAPAGDQPQRYLEIRETAKAFARLIDSLVPESREKALAMTNLEQTVMWACAGIARN